MERKIATYLKKAFAFYLLFIFYCVDLLNKRTIKWIEKLCGVKIKLKRRKKKRYWKYWNNEEMKRIVMSELTGNTDYVKL